MLYRIANFNINYYLKIFNNEIINYGVINLIYVN